MITVSEHIAQTFSVDHFKLRQAEKRKDVNEWEFNNGDSQFVVHVMTRDELISMEVFKASFWHECNPELVPDKEVMHLTTHSKGYPLTFSNYSNPDKGPFWYASGYPCPADYFVVFNSFEEARAYIDAYKAECKTYFKYKNWEESSGSIYAEYAKCLRPSIATSEHLQAAYDLGLIDLKNDHWIVKSKFGE